ncbi:MAG: HAD family hydrolase [Spirochaetaceae bacterium]|jgi:Cof subfamily protein (haloacid dehalogenase superfamily)|nr:HAD family hydrolase [Spirochaetaceae bacterium]
MTANDFDPQTIKALAFDLDGTLLSPGRTLGERNLRSLQSCMEKGIQIILSTGRSLDSGEKFRRRIGAKGPHVYYNGAEVADMSAGKMIYTRFIDPQPVLFCVELARRMGIYYQAYFPAGVINEPDEDSSGEVLMADKLTEESEFYEKSTGVPVAAGDLEAYLAKTPAIIKGMFITAEETLEKIRPILEERFGSSVYLARSCPVYLETLAAGVSKGAGLLHALDYLNLKPEHTIAFGDEENDLPMFEAAGFSAAPANAKEAVRKAAVFQIPSHAEDGVAVFLEEQFRIR